MSVPRAARLGALTRPGPALLAALVVVLLVVAGLVVRDLTGDDSAVAPDGVDVASVVDRASRSVVRVVPEPASNGTGLGFVLGNDGLVATAAHLVAGATRITVVLSDGTPVPARVQGADPDADLALLGIDRDDLESVTFADGLDLAEGTAVVAIGAGRDASAVRGVAGRVVALDGSLRRSDGTVQRDLLHVDARSASAEAGAPVLDREGRVVGIVLGAAEVGPAGVVAAPGWSARSSLARLSGAIG